MRITRLTTIARTGRLTKRSVNACQLSSGFGAGSLDGCTLLFTRTAAPLRSLNTPDVTTSSPGFTPEADADLIAARALELDDLLAHAAIGLAVRPLEVRRRCRPNRRTARSRSQTREWHDRTALADSHLRLNEHARPQLAVRVREGRLDLNVPRPLVRPSNRWR